VRAQAELKQNAQTLLGISARALEPLCTIKHSITRYRITLEVFRFKPERASDPALSQGHWLSLSQIRALPLASAHGRILQRL